MTLKKGHTARVLLGSTLGQEGPASIRFWVTIIIYFTEKKAIICKKHIKTCLFCVMHKNKQVLFTFIYMKSTSSREMVSNFKKNQIVLSFLLRSFPVSLHIHDQ